MLATAAGTGDAIGASWLAGCAFASVDAGTIEFCFPACVFASVGDGAMGICFAACLFASAGARAEFDFCFAGCVVPCAGTGAGGSAGEPPKRIMATRSSKYRLPRKSNLDVPSSVFSLFRCKAHHSSLQGNIKHIFNIDFVNHELRHEVVFPASGNPSGCPRAVTRAAPTR